MSLAKVSILGRESIHVGYNLIPHIVHTCLSELPAPTYVLITDTNIAPLYLVHFSEEFRARITNHSEYSTVPKDANFLTKIISPGETSKCIDTVNEVTSWMLAQKCSRDTVVIALGGGVIGDMIGFVAAIFMRGIKFVQVPTSLLAMVDSAIGGKTAIDTSHGKNLIGAFHQPEFIFEDLSFLNTLPNREFINGMAEVIKTAAIWNAEKFALLEESAGKLLEILSKPVSPDRFDTIRDLLQEVVLSSIAVKAEVVTADEKEGGLRNLLNFGHSIGHAYEAILTPEILHGEAVAIGMIKEAELSRYLGHLSPDAVGRLAKCLVSWGLPTSVHDKFITSKTGGRKTPVNRLLEIMTVDKKNAGRTKRVVLLKAIGQCYEMKATSVSDENIRLVISPDVYIHSALPASHDSDQKPRKVICRPPGSKSISNRAMVLAALSGGETRLTNLLSSDDTRYMQAALEQLGAAKFSWNEDGSLSVRGTGTLTNPGTDKEVFLGNAGTAARFLTSVVTLVSGSDPIVITGNERMKVRPIGPLVDALRSNGTSVDYLANDGCLPLSIRPGFRGGRVELSAKVSSQYVSSLLMIAPYAKEPVHLFLTGDKVISELYIDMTTAMMKTFGISVEKISTNEYRIPLGRYKAPAEYEIESDASSSTYPLALGALLGIEVHIPNIGSSSVQGDARFAKEVLEPMGCHVTQTSTSTTVKGPKIGTLEALDSIDMESMTDAFLTATVLAATTKGDMSITGIANQRVKECNRIAAMIHELHKFGVTKSSELPDGLTIVGTGLEGLKDPARDHLGDGIDTYDDHRIAMSFSLLAAVTPGKTLVLDKGCTSKTWPDWWDVLARDFGVVLSGADELPERPRATIDGESSILVVGMRGAGKTTMGSLAAQILGRPFIDLDDMLEEDHGRKIPIITAEDGWPSFRQKELVTLQKFIETRSRGWVAACGGGIVETPACVEILAQFAQSGGIVLQIHRDIDRIVQFLASDTTRPSWNIAKGSTAEEIYAVWQKRRTSFEKIANFQYYSSETTKTLDSTQKADAYARFLKHIQGRENHHQMLVEKSRSYFLSLTDPDIRTALPHLHIMTGGCDLIELRVDLLREEAEAIPSLRYVSEQVAHLRDHSDLPILFTIRTRSQGGQFPDDHEHEAVALMIMAGKWGIEYIDFEMTWSAEALREVRRHASRSKIIASHHDVSGELSFSSVSWMEQYLKGCRIGDIVKLIGRANSMADNFALESFRATVTGHDSTPLILINMGHEGRLSRMLNTFLTPITHDLLPSKAAPGQLTLKEMNMGLSAIGQLSAKQFFLFGQPISHSRSPALHNAGFSNFGLPHHYTRMESSTVQDYATVLQSGDFGGASVTIPHKQAIIPYLTEVSDEAKAIGAVNTIIPMSNPNDGRLRGDNTDWIGISNTLKSHTSILLERGAGIVLGAGGTARAAIFALRQLGLDNIYIANRSRKNLDSIVDSFPFVTPITSLEEAEAISQVRFAVSTVPGNSDLDANLSAIVSAVFARGDNSCSLLEMAYKPKITPIMELATARGWQTIEGLEPLVEQGFRQFLLWTGLALPISHGRDAILGTEEITNGGYKFNKKQGVAGNWQDVKDKQ